MAAFFGIAGIDAGTFNPQEDEYRYQHGAAHLAEQGFGFRGRDDGGGGMTYIAVIVKMRKIPHTSQRGCGLWSAPKVECKHVTFEGKDQHNDKDQDRQDFGDSGNGVDSRSAFNPAQYQNVESPKNDRGKQHRGNSIAVAKNREEGPQGGFDQHKVRDVTNTGPGPEAKCRGKS